MSGGARARLAALAVALALPAALPAGAAAADPAEAVLGARDAYASPRVLGPAAPAEQRVLARAAARLRADGRPVKLAIVAGPVGAPSLQAYARRLAERLDYEGTLLVTAPPRRIAAVGPTPSGEMAAAIEAAGSAGIANPAERVIHAAEAAASSADEAGPAWRPVAGLLALGVLGGAWAVALGLGRRGRDDRRRVAESRALLRVHLDALRARAVALGRRPDLPPDAREGVDHALGTYAEVLTALQQATSRDVVRGLAGRLRGGFGDIAGAARAVGESYPAERPFEGLCGADPAHGPAAGRRALRGAPRPVPVCARCQEASDEGRAPARRELPHDGRPVPFDEIPIEDAPTA